ncbi:hypothetical protein POM88_038683 [Heracleum sosnowskyi]|uniref:Ubiquitin-like protease family profile domain-containing protein n=1 Tax=Heracleum sosnowskyi TaxID=360622 RepID=A0AAD8M844_9APIA|nr:hypothetical protein POM88_038683 [Heracleum sosnowskyi]
MITFKQSDLAELEDPHSYLSDVIIEFYFTYLSSVHPSDSILYVPPSISFLLSNSIDDGVVEDCLKSLELPSKNLIFFTVHRWKHWSLLVYHRESNSFVHHDSSITGTNDDAARELYLSVKDCVHENKPRIKFRNRRFVDGPRYVDSQMWPEKNDYDCGSDHGSSELPWMRHMDGPRFVGSQMWRDDYGCGSYGLPPMQRRKSWINTQQKSLTSKWQEKNEDDCGLYEGPQMREKNNYDDSRFSDDRDCGLYDAFDYGSSVSPQMQGEKKEYDRGSYITPRMRGEKKEYDRGSYITPRMRPEKDEYDCGLQPRMQPEKNEHGYGLFICPKTPQQKNGFDCGLYVMAIAEAICGWFCEEGEEKSWIEKINDLVDDSLVSSMRARVLELIRDTSFGGLGTVLCTIEGEKGVGECSSNSDLSRGLEYDDDIVVTFGGSDKEETDGVDNNFWEDLNWSSNGDGDDSGTVDNIFWEDLDWSSNGDGDDSGTISDGDDCETIAEGLAELTVEEGKNDCRTLCESSPPLVAVGNMFANDSAPLMEEEIANGKVSTEFRVLVREEAVDESGMVEPSLSCDLTSASSCIAEADLVREEAVDESGMVEPSLSCDLTSASSCIAEADLVREEAADESGMVEPSLSCDLTSASSCIAEADLVREEAVDKSGMVELSLSCDLTSASSCIAEADLVREEAVDESGMVEPSLSCDLTSASSCIVEENKPIKDI